MLNLTRNMSGADVRSCASCFRSEVGLEMHNHLITVCKSW